MPDNDTPTRSSSMPKTEGERWSSDPDTVEVADRYAEGIGETNDNAGGISNRELSEEVDRQHNLPERGTTRRDRGPERPEETEGDVDR